MKPWSGVKIFYFEGTDGGFERCLEMNDDGTFVYWECPNRYAYKSGERFRSEALNTAQAKRRWPLYSEDIDVALSGAGR